ncbi:helix-turn-helix transcriptional regulator [Erwinia aphidicola]|uniref:helix-turn-helix domain-containing protein n=1 Tax=Erwinia aphidicola TaxID=68334 RepID=UPI00301AA485
MLIKRLKEARLRAGFSQEKLGVLAGIDEASASARMNQYERGKHTPDFEMMCKLAKILKVPENYFYTTDDVMAEMILIYNKLNYDDKKEIVEFMERLLEK